MVESSSRPAFRFNAGVDEFDEFGSDRGKNGVAVSGFAERSDKQCNPRWCVRVRNGAAVARFAGLRRKIGCPAFEDAIIGGNPVPASQPFRFGVIPPSWGFWMVAVYMTSCSWYCYH